jgi:hypothetical protein
MVEEDLAALLYELDVVGAGGEASSGQEVFWVGRTMKSVTYRPWGHWRMAQETPRGILIDVVTKNLRTFGKARLRTEETVGELGRSWLIQRLVSPRANEIHSFGGGYAYGGLSEEARALTHTCFDFDYMGAAEFEFGAVPEALSLIWRRQVESRSTYSGWTMSLDVSAPGDGAVMREALYTVSAEVYVIAPQEWTTEIEERIVTWSGEGWKSDLKEPTRLLSTLVFPEKTATKGWLELDNGFFFFVDKKMYEGVCDLLEVSAR